MMPDYDDEKLERFLLDGVPTPEREELEQRLFMDDELFARVEELENDLVDAFVRRELPADVQDRFERSLETNPARREKVAFGRLLHEELSTIRSTQRRVVRFFTRHRRAVSTGLAAALLVLLIGAPILLRNATPPPDAAIRPVVVAGETHDPATTAAPDASGNSAGESAAPQVAIKRPPIPTLAEPAVPGQGATNAVTLVLSTLTLRSGGGPATLDLRDDVDRVVITLALESDEFSSYNVDVRGPSGVSVWRGTRLPLTGVDESPALSFEVPATALATGRHELVLAGIDEIGSEEVAYIDFEVRRPGF